MRNQPKLLKGSLQESTQRSLPNKLLKNSQDTVSLTPQRNKPKDREHRTIAKPRNLIPPLEEVSIPWELTSARRVHIKSPSEAFAAAKQKLNTKEDNFHLSNGPFFKTDFEDLDKHSASKESKFLNLMLDTPKKAEVIANKLTKNNGGSFKVSKEQSALFPELAGKQNLLQTQFERRINRLTSAEKVVDAQADQARFSLAERIQVCNIIQKRLAKTIEKEHKVIDFATSFRKKSQFATMGKVVNESHVVSRNKERLILTNFSPSSHKSINLRRTKQISTELGSALQSDGLDQQSRDSSSLMKHQHKAMSQIVVPKSNRNVDNLHPISKRLLSESTREIDEYMREQKRKFDSRLAQADNRRSQTLPKNKQSLQTPNSDLKKLNPFVQQQMSIHSGNPPSEEQGSDEDYEGSNEIIMADELLLRAHRKNQQLSSLENAVKPRFDPELLVLEAENIERIERNTRRKISVALEFVSDKNPHISGMIKNISSNLKVKNRIRTELKSDPLEHYVKLYTEAKNVSEAKLQVLMRSSQVNTALEFSIKEKLIKELMKDGIQRLITKKREGRMELEKYDVVGQKLNPEQQKRKDEILKEKKQLEEQLSGFRKARGYGDQKDSILNKNMTDDYEFAENVGQNLRSRMERMKWFKQSKLMADDNKETADDPHMLYFKQCKNDLSLALPILEKIFQKTLCLQNYTLSAGHCRGLAVACSMFDEKVVNRIWFDNCGITGDELASIFEGVTKLHDFKSIVLRSNAFTSSSLHNLVPLLQRRIPYQLDELRLIECKISTKTTNDLLLKLIEEKSHLRKLSLVNANLSDASFQTLINYVTSSKHLEDLDISWCEVRHRTYIKLIRALKDNTQLHSLNLSWNNLLPEEDHGSMPELPSFLNLTNEQKNEIIQDSSHVQLFSPLALEILDSLRDFIKYNFNLKHLDLSHNGLSWAAIKQIGSCFRKAQSLRCVHFCGNPGICHGILDWMCLKSHSRANFGSVYPPLFKPKQQRCSTPMDTLMVVEDKWPKILDRLKMKSIIDSKRMASQKLSIMTEDYKRMIVQRKIGHKTMISGAGQWNVMSDPRDDCWICQKQIFTLFIWNSKIGNFCSVKDEEEVEHYANFMASRVEQDFMPEIQALPQIAGQFTNWVWKDMLDVASFCKENDPYPPDFIQELVNRRKIRSEVKTQNLGLNADEQAALQQEKNDFYQSHWQNAILRCLPYKSPYIALINQIKQFLQPNCKERMFFFIDFVKPGAHPFVVRETMKNTDVSTMNVLGVPQTTSFFMHKALVSQRREDVPAFHFERNVKTVHRFNVVAKGVFNDWQADSGQKLLKLHQIDTKLIALKTICYNPDDRNQVELIYRIHFEKLKDVFTYLQSFSNHYPYISTSCFWKYFVKESKLFNHPMINRREIDILFKNAAANKPEVGQEGGISASPNLLVRYEFFEICLRLARHMYATEKFQSTIVNPETNDKYNYVCVARSFGTFINEILLPFHEAKQISWQSFRDKELWVIEVDTLLTLNEKGCRNLYSFYTERKRSTGKPSGLDVMTYPDFEQLVIRDAKIQITKVQCQHIFAMSKMTVVKENEPSDRKQYAFLQYVEFLEAIGRIAKHHFQESELEEIQLAQKIEYTLDLLLALINEERQALKVITEEFSESEEDY